MLCPAPPRLPGLQVLRDCGQLAATRCPFDGRVSPSLEANLEHMASCHGFFVPYIADLVSVSELLEYLVRKVAVIAIIFGLSFCCRAAQGGLTHRGAGGPVVAAGGGSARARDSPQAYVGRVTAAALQRPYERYSSTAEGAVQTRSAVWSAAESSARHRCILDTRASSVGARSRPPPARRRTWIPRGTARWPTRCALCPCCDSSSGSGPSPG